MKIRFLLVLLVGGGLGGCAEADNPLTPNESHVLASPASTPSFDSGFYGSGHAVEGDADSNDSNTSTALSGPQFNGGMLGSGHTYEPPKPDGS